MTNDIFKTMNEDGELFYDTESVEQFVADAESVEVELRKEVSMWSGMYCIAARRADKLEVENMRLREDVKALELTQLEYTSIPIETNPNFKWPLHGEDMKPIPCGKVNKYHGYVCVDIGGHSGFHSCLHENGCGERYSELWPNAACGEFVVNSGE